jgi:hypothetical protein
MMRPGGAADGWNERTVAAMAEDRRPAGANPSRAPERRRNIRAESS